MKPRRVARHKTCLFCSFLEALILLVEEVIFGDAHLNIWNDTRLFLNGYPPSPCSVLKWKNEPTRAAVPENSSSKRASGWLIKISFGTEQPHIEVPFPHKYLNTGLRASWLGRTRPKCEDVVGVAVLKLRDRDADLRLRESFIFERWNNPTNLLADATLKLLDLRNQSVIFAPDIARFLFQDWILGFQAF